jgi:hypothetical protein
MRSLALALCAAALAAAATGCAAATAGEKAGSPGEAYVALVDVSYSTAKARAKYAPDLVALAGRAADARAPLYADAFDGDPAARIRWQVRGAFDAELPQVYDGNETLADQFLAKQARELRPQLEGLLDERTSASGSPLGGTLKAAAGACEQHAPRACKVFVFTDGVFIGEDFDARKGGESARRKLVDRWADRLSGLGGAEVTFVGVGYGTRATDGTLERSRLAAEALLTASGATMADWNVALAPA